jgi:cytidyltransferase-like protein
MKKKAVIVSGYFNPIHKGHIEYLHMAKSIANTLFVIVNSDYQRNLKESNEFILEDERMLIINELKIVDKTILSIDKDRSVCKTIEQIHKDYSDDYEFSFANGGDQNNQSIPEFAICQKLGINLIDGLGNKIQSSSWLLNKRKRK